MFGSSPTKLLLRCSTCAECAEISREDFDVAQPFCSQDGTPFTVIAVAAGVLKDRVWPDKCPCRNAGQPHPIQFVPRTKAPVLVEKPAPTPTAPKTVGVFRRKTELVGV